MDEDTELRELARKVVTTELGFEFTSETFTHNQGHDPFHNNAAGRELGAYKSPEGRHPSPARTG